MIKRAYLQQISEKFHAVKAVPGWLRDLGPWVQQLRALRSALGMTQAQLGARAGLSQSQVAQIENTPDRDLQLSTLRALAGALECELVIAMVPKKEIQSLLEERAEALAKKILQTSVSSNTLELQKPDKASVEQSLQALKEDILNRRKSLWQTT